MTDEEFRSTYRRGLADERAAISDHVTTLARGLRILRSERAQGGAEALESLAVWLADKPMRPVEPDAVPALLRESNCVRCGRGAPSCRHGLCADCNVIDQCRHPVEQETRMKGCAGFDCQVMAEPGKRWCSTACERGGSVRPAEQEKP